MWFVSDQFLPDLVVPERIERRLAPHVAPSGAFPVVVPA